MNRSDVPYNQHFSGTGILWFMETSWHYINPRGLKEVIQFIVGFLGAYRRFRNSMSKRAQHD